MIKRTVADLNYRDAQSFLRRLVMDRQGKVSEEVFVELAQLVNQLDDLAKLLTNYTEVKLADYELISKAEFRRLFPVGLRFKSRYLGPHADLIRANTGSLVHLNATATGWQGRLVVRQTINCMRSSFAAAGGPERESGLYWRETNGYRHKQNPFNFTVASQSADYGWEPFMELEYINADKPVWQESPD